MKKSICLLVVFLFAVPVLSFAAVTNGTTGSFDVGATNKLKVSTSRLVYIVYSSDTTNDGSTFALSTYHEKGTRSYMSSSEDANIYYAETIDNAAPAAPSVGTSVGKTATFTNTL